MLDITGTEIKLTRGNSGTVDLDITDAITGERYVPSEGDKFVFTMKGALGFKLQKVLTIDDFEDGILKLHFDPKDTINACDNAKYRYDMLALLDSGYCETFVSGTVEILRAVGTYQNIDGGERYGE